MVKYENDCVDCGLPCLGSSCPYRNVRHLYCDKCTNEVTKLFEVDGSQLCEECAIDTWLATAEVIE